jgi:hypothetical protein
MKLNNMAKKVKDILVKKAKVVKVEKPAKCTNCNDSGMACISCRAGIDVV